MSGTFDFCPLSRVAEIQYADEDSTVLKFNGWEFTTKPTQPLQRKFKVTLHGLRWYLTGSTLDTTTDSTRNAGRLEQFYQANRMWDNFTFVHEYAGTFQCRFASPVNIPMALKEANGLLGPLEVSLVHANPSYS